MMRVALLPKNLPDKPILIFLKHPRTNQPSPFLVSQTKIYEVFDFNKEPSSFLLNNQTISCGDVLTVAEIHPLFLALPLIMERNKELYSLDGYFNDSELKIIEPLIKPCFPLVCDPQRIDQYVVWAFNEKKTIDWLCSKISKLVTFLSRTNPIDEKLLVVQAHDILRHYMRAWLAQKLKDELKTRFPGAFSKIVLNFASDQSTKKAATKIQSDNKDHKQSGDVNNSDVSVIEKTEKKQNKKSTKNQKSGTNKSTSKASTSAKKKTEPKIAKNSLENFFAPTKK